jgi:Xaa-Pro aminopeptidase
MSYASATKMASRLADLRSRMMERNLFAYIIPHQDAHSSEYLSSADERIAFISRFDGSAGTCVVTQSQALLWTDGRYFNQATKQLPEGWTLMRDRVPGTPKVSEWLVSECGKEKVVGVDSFLTSVSSYNDLSAKLNIVCLNENLVDQVWGSERPLRSQVQVRDHAIEFAGQSRSEKLAAVRSFMEKEDSSITHMLISTLDEIAWILNLRGCDIDYNPLFFSYCAIESNGAVSLFVDSHKVPESLQAALLQDKISVRPYDEFLAYVSSISSKVWVDTDSVNLAVYQAIAEGVPKVEKSLPIALMKAKKNPVELQGFRDAHIRDGAAETKWLHWLATQVMNKPDVYQHHTEVTLADKLEDFRRSMNYFQGLSFASISSFGPNAAIIHYHARPESCAVADPKQIYLIDSGATYSDGTTDITRTVHFGAPSAREIDAFTRVLQGVIRLSQTTFPPGTNGPALDSIARHALWQAGLDYRHGTGHGVGHSLCVHEGPQGISPPMFNPRSTTLKTPLEVGMVLSNEPGYYEDGNFGIRIENLMAVVESDIVFALSPEQKRMLTFETLTMVPIQKSLIDVSLLSDTEIEWINTYHAEVLEKISSYMSDEEKVWLTEQCAPITRTVVQSPSKRTRNSPTKQM